MVQQFFLEAGLSATDQVYAYRKGPGGVVQRVVMTYADANAAAQAHPWEWTLFPGVWAPAPPGYTPSAGPAGGFEWQPTLTRDPATDPA